MVSTERQKNEESSAQLNVIERLTYPREPQTDGGYAEGHLGQDTNISQVVRDFEAFNLSRSSN